MSITKYNEPFEDNIDKGQYNSFPSQIQSET